MQHASMDLHPDDVEMNLASASDWDLAVRYHEFKASKAMEKKLQQLRRMSAAAILDRASQVLGSVIHPSISSSCPSGELPSGAEFVDLDLESTVENSPLAVQSVVDPKGKAGGFQETDLWIEYKQKRPQALILSVDTSLSMTGEKLALTAVALAVVLLQFPDDPVGIVAFENEAKVLKHPDESISLFELVERFLDVPAQGYTHLEDGLRSALKLQEEVRGLGQNYSISTVLLTDGKYTAGKDPAYLAPRFPHLVVLKMGHERASRELCLELAKKGKGNLKEIGELDTLPMVMYETVKDILRGRSNFA